MSFIKRFKNLFLLKNYPCLDKAHGANRIFRINSTNHVKLVYDVVQTNWIYISSKEREREKEGRKRKREYEKRYIDRMEIKEE